MAQEHLPLAVGLMVPEGLGSFPPWHPPDCMFVLGAAPRVPLSSTCPVQRQVDPEAWPDPGSVPEAGRG